MQNKSVNQYINRLKDHLNENDYESCIKLLLNAINQYPDEKKLKLNLGNIYKLIGDMQNAKEIYNSLLDTSLKEIAQNNLSLIMFEEGNIDEGIEYAKDAITMNADYSDAKYNLSLGFFEKKEYSQSLELCNELMSDNDYKDRAYELKIRINQIICSWDTYSQTQEFLKSNQIIVHPFLHISYVMNEESNYNNAKKWNVNLRRIKKDRQSKKSTNKIKLGFLCGEIREHPTFYLIKYLFTNIKNSDVLMYMFSYNHYDKQRQQIEDNFDEFIDITNMSYFEGYEKIKSYELDILIDLTTIISHNRINMLDKNISRVTIAYLAFPGTTGSDIYDYMLTDTIVTPQNMQKHYNEKFLHLPKSYQINNGKFNLDKKTKREAYNLPNDGIILGCLNQSFKLEPIFFNIWINILKQHENTYLWLLDEGYEMKNNIMRFSDNMIDKERVIFAEKISYEKHLDRIQHIDIALDTRIYNGHTTSIEMLQAGIPLVTLKGAHFASRVSASILNALEIDQLITNSETEYKSKIISLLDKDYRTHIKNEIIDKLKTTKILDNKYFCDNFLKTILSTIT